MIRAEDTLIGVVRRIPVDMVVLSVGLEPRPDAACISGNMPCTGCLGPTDGIRDYGAKALSSIASVLNSDDEKEIDTLLKAIVDPGGTFYRYSLPASLLPRQHSSQ